MTKTSTKATVTKPKILEHVLQIGKWIDMGLAPLRYTSAPGYGHVNGFPNPRAEAMADGADGTAAYKAVAKLHTDGGNTDAKKALHKA